MDSLSQHTNLFKSWRKDGYVKNFWGASLGKPANEDHEPNAS